MDEPTPAASIQPAPRGLAACHELLTDPLAPVRRAIAGRPTAGWPLVVCGLLGFALYGAAAGMFQGGTQIAVAAWKGTAIAALALLLCLPSLYVFGALAGARWTYPAFRAVVVGLLATLGMLLGGLLPIAWLFSSSSRFLGTVVWIHVVLWIVALGLAFRFLSGAFRELGARGGSFLWLALFLFVSFQVTTLLRPVLWRPAGAPVLRLGEKKSFFENFGDVFDVKPAEAKSPEKKEPAKAPQGAPPAAAAEAPKR
ncbi:MAG TPA: hypothetical protein VN851_18795 [Thermoanaerobaculia bacterium]|nr:hypothetical protein [Thermoanaerobaculia bacterium]